MSETTTTPSGLTIARTVIRIVLCAMDLLDTRPSDRDSIIESAYLCLEDLVGPRGSTGKPAAKSETTEPATEAKPAKPKRTRKPKADKAAAKTETPAETSKPTETKLTEAVMRNGVRAMFEKAGRPAVVEILAKYDGAKLLREVPESSWPDLALDLGLTPAGNAADEVPY